MAMIPARFGGSSRIASAFIAATFAAALSAAPAFAHAHLTGSTPADGSTVPASPATIELHFNQAAQLTSATVAGADDKAARKLEFTPTGSSDTFTITAPKLADGRNEIAWKALSKDGHVSAGSIKITVTPGVTAAPPAKAAEHEHHGEHGDHDHH